jgi:hypothetical protein
LSVTVITEAISTSVTLTEEPRWSVRPSTTMASAAATAIMRMGRRRAPM